MEGKRLKRAMISQPMNGLTDEQIEETRNKAIKALEAEGYEIVNTLFTDEWYSDKAMKERGVTNTPLCFLAKSLENMSLCDTVCFCKGWNKARGCKIEYRTACDYGVNIVYLQDDGSLYQDVPFI